MPAPQLDISYVWLGLKIRVAATSCTATAALCGSRSCVLPNGHVLFSSSGTPAAPLHIWGEAIIGSQGLACSGTTEGAIRYNSAGVAVEVCDGSAWSGVGGGGGGDVYDIAAFMPSTPNANAVIRVVMPRAIELPAGLTDSRCIASVAANGATTVTLNKVSGGTTTAIGSLDWAASGTTCTFTLSSAVSFAAGDILEVVFPSSPDSKLADIAITFAATKL